MRLLWCSVLRRATTFLVVAGEWVTFGKAPTLGGLVSLSSSPPAKGVFRLNIRADTQAEHGARQTQCQDRKLGVQLVCPCPRLRQGLHPL